MAAARNSVAGRNSTADRTMDVLLLFESRPVLSAPQVAEELGMSRSTTYRYLQSLRSYDLLEEDGDGIGFRLGPRVIQLAHAARRSFGMRELALPVMRRLMEETDETVLLTRRLGDQVVCVERVASTHPVRLSYEIGHSVPVHAGAAAKVILAYIEPAELDLLLSRSLPRLTPKSVTDPARLRRQLDEIRRQGYAVTHGEADANVVGIAAPVRNGDRVVAGLSIAGVDFRITQRDRPRLIKAVVRAANEVSEQITSHD